MKRKMLSFFIMLAVVTASIGGLSVYALADVVAFKTSTIFVTSASSNFTTLQIKDDACAHMQAVKSEHKNNYKIVQMDTYRSTINGFDEIGSNINEGRATDVCTKANLSGATNVLVMGQLLDANDVHSTIKEIFALNVRQKTEYRSTILNRLVLLI